MSDLQQQNPSKVEGNFPPIQQNQALNTPPEQAQKKRVEVATKIQKDPVVLPPETENVVYVAVRRTGDWPHENGHKIFGVTKQPVTFNGKGISIDIDQANLEHFLKVPGFVGVTAEELG